MALLALVEEGPKLDKGQGCFSKQSRIGACVLSLNGVNLARRKLQAPYFV